MSWAPYNTLIPYSGFTQFTPTLPDFYWDVYSSEQRIKHICYELCKLHAYSDYLAESIDTLGANVENELKEIRKEIAKNEASFKKEVLRLIADLETGTLQWDVQRGEYASTIEAQRDMFNDVTIHSYNNEQLEQIFSDLNMTVDDLANCGLNVKGYALMNHVLLKPKKITDDMVPTNPTKKGSFTVNDLMQSALDLSGYVYVEGDN